MFLAAEGFARADDGAAAQPPPPPPGQPEDAWSAAMKRGMKTEGIKTDEEQQQEEKRRDEEAGATTAEADAKRQQLRLGAFVGLGGGFGTTKTLDATSGLSAQAAGAEFQVGVGLRKGLAARWVLQLHALFTYISPEKSSTTYYSGYYGSSSGAGTKPGTDKPSGATGVSLDGTARYHMGGLRRPWYLGFGGRLDILGYANERVDEVGIDASPPVVLQRKSYASSSAYVEPNGLLEVGIVVPPSDVIDIGLRLAAGASVHLGVMLGASF
jgi:hypothetical protein